MSLWRCGARRFDGTLSEPLLAYSNTEEQESDAMHSRTEFSIGCIGCGNMGGAILAGIAEHTSHTLYGFDIDRERMRPLIAKGVRAVADMISLVRGSTMVIIALKPYLVEPVLREIKPHLKPETLLISVAAGVSLNHLQKAVDGVCPVVRVMPNTPALVGAGVFALCLDDPALKPEQKKTVLELFGSIGTTIDLPDEKFNAFTAVFGAGPAYVFYIMQSLTQAAVTLGFTKAEAARLVNALFTGSAKLAQGSETGHAELREMVCAPGGATICGINYMARRGMRGHIVDAVLAAYMRGLDLEK
jgi:pyrroline-5-carboxylate reductase